jgi:hypothetical protein
MMRTLELGLLEDKLFSLFVMFFAATVSLVLNKLTNYVSEKTTVPKIAMSQSNISV